MSDLKNNLFFPQHSCWGSPFLPPLSVSRLVAGSAALACHVHMWFICKSAHSEPHFCKQIPCFICTHMYKADVNSCLPTLICSSYVEMQRCTSARFDFLPSFICSSYVKCQHSLGAHMLELSTLAASSYSHVFTCRISARRTGRTDRTDGQDGQDGRIVGQKDNAKLDPKTQYLTLGPKF